MATPRKANPKDKRKNLKNYGTEGAPERFNPAKAGYERWDIRKAQRHLAAQRIDPFDAEAIKKLIGNRDLTIAETIAIRQMQRAMNSERAAEHVTNNVCGKLAETINLPPQPQPLDEDTKAAYKQKFTKPNEVWALLDAAILEKPQGHA